MNPKHTPTLKGKTAEMEAMDTKTDLVWGRAIYDFRRGSPKTLIELLNSLQIPEDAKYFFNDLLKGQLEPLYKGRPPTRTGQQERKIILEALSEWDRLKQAKAKDARDTAFSNVANHHEISEDTVRGIMSEARKFGLTLEFYKRYIAPKKA